MPEPLNAAARAAQAACLRGKGYETEARQVEAGQVDYDPDALEMLEPRDA